ncbi:MAG: STAS domain-containing protein [Candidatus Sericytochromatia bacterium]|uniref:STAS domain-containing protein n=1 Tax=Candidatus Tanganyikabacteria bacterium TaxID=2961651 RepID=A0A938BIW1_9BACT|nr:STAS domain-containing protein [Candidatus Tanganyikabacteria bacterium]
MTNDLAVTVRKGPDYAVIYTDGYVNNLGGEKIGETARSLMDEGVRQIVINMEKSTVVNSIGVSILIELIEQIQEAEGKIFFCNLTKVIAKTFTIMGLAQFAGMAETEEAAIAALSA